MSIVNETALSTFIHHFNHLARSEPALHAH